MLRRFFGGSDNSTDYKAFKDKKDQPKQGNTAASAQDVAVVKDDLASAGASRFSFGGKKPEPKPATQAKGTESTPLLGR